MQRITNLTVMIKQDNTSFVSQPVKDERTTTHHLFDVINYESYILTRKEYLHSISNKVQHFTDNLYVLMYEK